MFKILKYKIYSEKSIDLDLDLVSNSTKSIDLDLDLVSISTCYVTQVSNFTSLCLPPFLICK